MPSARSHLSPVASVVRHSHQDAQTTPSSSTSSSNLSGEHVQDTELMMAGSVLTIMPVMLVFLFLQRYYIQGVMVGSVKG